MTENQTLYREKLTTIDDALMLIRSGDTVCLAGDCNEPVQWCNRFHTIADRVKDVICYKARTGFYPFLTEPGMDGHINTEGFFYGPGWSQGSRYQNCSLVPSALSDFPGLMSAYRPSNVFVAAVTPMDEHGNMQISLCLMWEPECLATCEKIILEVNPQLPRVRGGLEINIKDVTALYEVNYPVAEIPDMVITALEEKIGENVASLIHDGDCIQLGIGALPNAVAKHLMDKKDLGLHTEMFTSAMGRMIKQGVITGERKNFNPRVHLGCFAGGDQALYQTMSETENLRIMPGSYCVDPYIIMKNDNMVSINTAVEIDLTGQVCSESIGAKQISGSGGGFCFAMGAFYSKGGRGILAFPSKTAKGNSKIKTELTPGAVVTIPRNYVDYIVTEYGIAPMRGRSIRQRVQNLIAIAHPDLREDLRKDAKKLLYI